MSTCAVFRDSTLKSMMVTQGKRSAFKGQHLDPGTVTKKDLTGVGASECPPGDGK